MEDIAALYDLLMSSSGFDWMSISEELLDAGYSWQWIFHQDGTEVFHLLDLYHYFA